MSEVAEMSIAEVMKARTSVRKYKKGLQIPKETLDEILELASTAPSSWNLQHWKFIVIQDEENKKKILPIAFNQQQIVDCSALIVVLADTEANQNAEELYGEAVKAGYMTEAAKETLVGQINNAYQSNANIGVYEAIRNASLASMQLMLAAKAKGIDSCPIGGYLPQALIEELNIPARYMPNMLITLGYAEKPAHQTGRFPLEHIVIEERF